MTTQAVDQDQGLVGTLTAQGGRADGVRAVGRRRAGEVQGRNRRRQLGRQFGRAALFQRLGGDHIDGGDRVQAGAVGDAGAGDDDVVH